MIEKPADVRVLLISPLLGRDHPSGDTTYTEELISNPPPGFCYTTYADALEDGSLRIRGRRPSRGAVTLKDLPILGFRAVESIIRGRIAFREPILFYTVDGSYDLIHQHVFSVRQVSSRVPTVSTAGYPLSIHYAQREGWPSWRLAVARGIDGTIARALAVHMPGVYAPRSEQLTVYTRTFQQYLSDNGQTALRVSQGLPLIPVARRPDRTRRVGFIGRDFGRKGGDLAVAAFTEARKVLPDLQLDIITAPNPRNEELARSEGINVFESVERQAIITVFLPTWRAMLLPTRADCGAPYAVLEGLRAGVPVITSHNRWLDDRLQPPAVFRASLSAASVAQSLLEVLATPGLSDAARNLFLREFNYPKFANELSSAYRSQLARADVKGASHQ